MGDDVEPPLCEGCGRPILQLDRAGRFRELVEVDGPDCQPTMVEGRVAWFHIRHRPQGWRSAGRDEAPGT